MRSQADKDRAARGRDRMARFIDTVLPIAGVTTVLLAVILGGGGWSALFMAVAGLLMVEAGTWRLGSRVMHERRDTPFRSEVERFLGLVPTLYRAAGSMRDDPGPNARSALDGAVEAMHDSIDRMVVLASGGEAEAAESPVERTTTVDA
jgi:hypothetical protein